jgi:flagellar protein FlbD
MIKVTRLNGSELVINVDLIEFVEAIPDTIVSLVTGKKIMIKETTDTVIQKVAEFKRLSSGLHVPKKVEEMQGEKHA